MIEFALTLISNPAEPKLSSDVIDEIARFVEQTTSCTTRRNTLSEGVCVDIMFTAPSEAQGEISTLLQEKRSLLQIDCALQPHASRKKSLLIADMDSTIIEQECIDELAEFVGKRSEISAITERAMRGELDFEDALKGRVRMLKGLKRAHLEQAFRERITLTPGAKTLVQTMRANGAFTALVSGGFTFFTECVSDVAGFHVNKANTLEMENDQLTGEIEPPILGREAKEVALRAFVDAQNIPLAHTLAVGDGANDLSMLSAAGLGVAFHAKPAVAEAADIRIDHGDLTALLYLQGIPQSAFVAPSS